MSLVVTKPQDVAGRGLLESSLGGFEGVPVVFCTGNKCLLFGGINYHSLLLVSHADCVSACPCPRLRTQKATPVHLLRFVDAAQDFSTCPDLPSRPRKMEVPPKSNSRMRCCCLQSSPARGTRCQSPSKPWSRSCSWTGTLDRRQRSHPLSAATAAQH